MAASALSACSGRPQNGPASFDISLESRAALHSDGEYTVRPKSNLKLRCICIFGGDDAPYREGLTGEAVLYRTYSGCSNSNTATAYSPLPVGPDDGLLVLIGDPSDRTKVELQRFKVVEPFGSILNKHAPGCFPAEQVVINKTSEPLRLIRR
jgi:hypothetical protein